MWAVAADAGGPGEALVYAVWTFLGILVTTLGTVAVQGMRSRSERTTASPPPPSDGTVLVQLAEKQGSLVQRADDNDDRDDWQDKRLERLERWAEDHDPDWRG